MNRAVQFCAHAVRSVDHVGFCNHSNIQPRRPPAVACGRLSLPAFLISKSSSWTTAARTTAPKWSPGSPGRVMLREQNAGRCRGQKSRSVCQPQPLCGVHRFRRRMDERGHWPPRGAARREPRRFCDSLRIPPWAVRSAGSWSFVETYGGDAFDALPYQTREGIRVLERRPFLIQLSTRNVMFLEDALRRDAFEALEGFDRSLCGAADWDLFMRVTAMHHVAFSDGPAVSLYDQHAAAMSTDVDHMEEDFIKALESVHLEVGARTRGTCPHRGARPRAYFHWAYHAYDRGDLKTARRRLRRGSQAVNTKGLRETTYLVADVSAADGCRCLAEGTPDAGWLASSNETFRRHTSRSRRGPELQRSR